MGMGPQRGHGQRWHDRSGGGDAGALRPNAGGGCEGPRMVGDRRGVRDRDLHSVIEHMFCSSCMLTSVSDKAVAGHLEWGVRTNL